MKIVGINTGHDCSYCLLENGIPVVHEEWERFSRVKESDTNVFEFMAKRLECYKEIKHITHWPCNRGGWESLFKDDKLTSFNEMKAMVKNNGGDYYQFGHHQSHAANAFFSSNYDKALILTLDAGGCDAHHKIYVMIGSKGLPAVISKQFIPGFQHQTVTMVYTFAVKEDVVNYVAVIYHALYEGEGAQSRVAFKR